MIFYTQARRFSEPERSKITKHEIYTPLSFEFVNLVGKAQLIADP